MYFDTPSRSVTIWAPNRVVPFALLIVLIMFLGSWGGSHQLSAQEIVIPSALIKLMDHAEIAAPEAGVIAELGVQEGDEVPRGELIARLDDTDAVLGEQRARREVAIAEAEANNRVRIQSAEADLRLAESDLARATESRQKFARSVSPAEMERFELAVQAGNAGRGAGGARSCGGAADIAPEASRACYGGAIHRTEANRCSF
jgi:multidrug resistance efflux pump